MLNAISATTTFVIQADKGSFEWYDFAFETVEHIARSNFHTIHRERPWERHRLVRRMTLDTELLNKERDANYASTAAQ